MHDLAPVEWYLYDTQRQTLETVALARALTVTPSPSIKVREDSRTHSIKRPEGGNGGERRTMSGMGLEVMCTIKCSVQNGPASVKWGEFVNCCEPCKVKPDLIP